MRDATSTIAGYAPPGSDEFHRVEIRAGGWFGCVEISFRFPHCPPDDDVADLGFLAVDPDGFAFRMRIRTTSVFVGDDPESWGGRECRRLLDVLMSGGKTSDVAFFAVDGTRDETARSGWVEDDRRARKVRSPEVPADLAIVADAASGRLGDRIAGRYRSSLCYANDKMYGNLSAPMFMVPETRPRAMALASLRPWMLSSMSPTTLLEMVESEPVVEALVSPARLASLRMAKTRRWSERAIACVDRFGPAERGPYNRNADEETVVLLDALPLDWHPRNEEEFAVAACFSGICDRNWTFGRDDLRLLMTGLKGRWRDFARSVVVDGGGGSLQAQLNGIGDMLDHVARNLVHPTLPEPGKHADAASRKVARRLVSRDGGLGLLAKRSGRWHEGWWELPTLERREYPAWPKFAPDRTCGNLTMTFLDTPAALREESRRMEHCVASKTFYCAMGWTHVASIAKTDVDGTTRPTSTLEVRFEYTPDLVVVQHRGPRNVDPSPEDTAFVERWLRDARNLVFPLDTSGQYGKTGMADASTFGIPPSGTPSDWKGILAKEFTAMDWPELVETIRRLHPDLKPKDAMPFNRSATRLGS